MKHPVDAMRESKEVQKHFDLMPKINKLYSTVVKSKKYTGFTASRLVSACKKDIAIAPAVKKAMGVAPAYPSFRQLGAVYEKRGDYKSAAKVYQQAVNAGFKDGGTGKSFSERLQAVQKLL